MINVRILTDSCGYCDHCSQVGASRRRAHYELELTGPTGTYVTWLCNRHSEQLEEKLVRADYRYYDQKNLQAWKRKAK